MSARRQITESRLLIGEGIEEVRFFGALLAHLGINDMHVEHYGGKNGLSSYLKTLKVRPGWSALNGLGITRDADDDASKAFQSVCSMLNNAGLSMPGAPGIVAGTNPRISVLILPDGNNAGMLEDLCFSAVQTNPEAQCIEDFIACVQGTTGRQPGTKAKARMHAWLSSLDKPDLRLGEAAQRGYIPWDSHIFQHVKSFLINL
jgi:hypothetical protein